MDQPLRDFARCRRIDLLADVGVRESRFRLNQDGKLYDIPVTSDEERYSKKVTTDPAHETDRRRLQTALDQFMAIKSEIAPKRKGGTKSKNSKGKPN